MEQVGVGSLPSSLAEAFNSCSLSIHKVTELMKKLGLDMTKQTNALANVMVEMDKNRNGYVDLKELTSWWKRAGHETQEKMTELNDKMRLVRELFDNVDEDASGKLERGELSDLVTTLGFQMSPKDLDEAMDRSVSI